MADKHIIDAMRDDSPIDVSREVNFIWSIANKLRGPYKSDKYKDVIIPMTIIRRFECALAPTKDAVVKLYGKSPSLPTKAFCKASGYSFYNTSSYTLHELLNDPDNIADNIRSYISGFSPNVPEIIASFDFDKDISKMSANNRMFGVVKAFSELDLDPQTIDNMKMGCIFEELIRKFSENAEAGDRYTGRDIIKLMVSVLLAERCDDIFDSGKVVTILDQACGTGGMLSTAFNFIKRFNDSADITLFGQEIDPESYAMCLAEMLIKGQDADNVRLQDTMKADCFPAQKMRFVIEDPPFGQPWGGKDAAEGVEEEVRAEHAKGARGRWGAGLPGTGDMQLLFIQSAIDSKRNEISPEDRAEITRLYADFRESERVKIFPNTEFIYREYAVMQPLQRSYAVTADRIERLRSSRTLDAIYSPSKVRELESTLASGEELDAKSASTWRTR